MKRASIIVGFTPYHAYVAEKIIGLTEGGVYCCFSKRWPRKSIGYRSIGFSGKWLHHVRGILSFIWFATFIRLLIIRRISLDIYMPHPGNILSNYLFFTPLRGKKIYIYEDGILNYYDAKVENKFVGKLKKILACLGGMPYKDYSGHVAGYDAGKYDGAFFSMPDIAVRKECIGILYPLIFKQRSTTLKERTVLFLDQNTFPHITSKERTEWVARIFNMYPPDEYLYYYKPHHDHGSDFAKIMQKIPKELEELPAESIVDVLRPKNIVSFYSSALVNIKNSYPNANCISMGAHKVHISRDGVDGRLSDLFEMAGVCSL